MRIIFRKLFKRQSGFTLIEILIGVAIAGAIVAAAAGGVTQVIKGSPESNNRMQVINNIQNASQYITQDARNAEKYYFYNLDGSLNENIEYEEDDPDQIKSFSLENDADISKIVFECKEMDGEGAPVEDVIISYILNDDPTLDRIYNNTSTEPEIVKNTQAARYIESMVLESGSDNATVNLKITAELGNAVESRVYSILLRNNN